MTFADHFTFEHFQNFTAAVSDSFSTGSYKRTPEMDHWDAKCDEALADFMIELRNSGKLKTSVPLDKRNRWVASWNRFVQDPAAPYAKECLVPLSRFMTQSCFAAQSADADLASRLHAKVCAKFDAGHFDCWDLSEQSAEPCPSTGESFRAGLMNGWQPVLLKFKGGDRSFEDRFEIVTGGIEPQQVLHVAIPAPSGNMIAADWFRLEGNLFSSAVEAREINFEINYEFGRRAQTEHYAKEMGFLSISVGNSSPSLLKRDGHFVLASETGDDHPVGKPLGSICTDLWWATVIDEAVLRSLIERKHGVEGLKALDAYLIEDDNHFRFRVPKGTMHAYYSAGRMTLAEFTPQGLDFNRDGLRSVHGVFSDHEIEWVANAPVAAKTSRLRRA